MPCPWCWWLPHHHHAMPNIQETSRHSNSLLMYHSTCSQGPAVKWLMWPVYGTSRITSRPGLKLTTVHQNTGIPNDMWHAEPKLNLSCARSIFEHDLLALGGGGEMGFSSVAAPKMKLWGVKCCCSHFKFVHIWNTSFTWIHHDAFAII